MNTTTVLDRRVFADVNERLADLVEHARAISISSNLPHEVRAFANNFLALHEHMSERCIAPAAWS